MRWKLPDLETFRTAFPAMLRFRKMTQEDLGWKMAEPGAAHPRTIFSAFLNNTQKDMKLSSFLEAMKAMDLDVIIERQTGKSQRSRAALRAEREADLDVQAKRDKTAEYAEQGRDADGKLLDVGSLSPERRAEIEELLNKYSSF